MHDHLSQLSEDPPVNKPGELTVSALEEDQLLEMANDGGLQSMFERTSNLHTFWTKVKAEYPEMAAKALKSLLPFPASSLCEAVSCSDGNQNKITE